MEVRDKLYIDGAWVPSTGKGTLEVVNSTTEEVMGTIPEGTPEDVDRAAEAAAAAFPAWSATSADERGKILAQRPGRAHGAHRGDRHAHRPGGGHAVHLVQPHPGRTARHEFRHRRPAGHRLRLRRADGQFLIVREPVGVVGAITPWNYPLHQIAAKVAPALAVGCTVVLKPSEVAPLNAFILAEILDEVGVPAGVFNLVTGVGPVVGEAIASHPLVDMVSFTGSTRAGKRVMQLASESVKARGPGTRRQVAQCDPRRRRPRGRRPRRGRRRLHELGSDVLGPDADDRPPGALGRGGGTGREDGRDLHHGRSVRRRHPARAAGVGHQTRVRGYIHKGISEGAKLLTGGAESPDALEKGYFVRPTVFSDVTTDMTIAQEEIFGPVLSIIPYDTEEEAIRIANDTVYGLAGGCGRGTRTRRAGGPPGACRPGGGERRRVQRHGTVRRLQAVRHRPGSSGASGSRSFWR